MPLPPPRLNIDSDPQPSEGLFWFSRRDFIPLKYCKPPQFIMSSDSPFKDLHEYKLSTADDTFNTWKSQIFILQIFSKIGM